MTGLVQVPMLKKDNAHSVDFATTLSSERCGLVCY